MPDLSLTEWLLAIVAAMGIGVAKAGFAGVSRGTTPRAGSNLAGSAPGELAPALSLSPIVPLKQPVDRANSAKTSRRTARSRCTHCAVRIHREFLVERATRGVTKW